MPRPEVKNRLKQLIYTALSEYTGKKLPWGTLTGIRPTKIPMTLLEQGTSKGEILHYMQEHYFVSTEKGELAIEIADREKKLLDTLHYENGYSLYIGIPFVPPPVYTVLLLPIRSFPGKENGRVSGCAGEGD